MVAGRTTEATPSAAGAAVHPPVPHDSPDVSAGEESPGQEWAGEVLCELRGQRIGVTAARRGGDLCAALQQRGAQVVHAPALSVVPADQDVPVINATRALLEGHPEVLLVSTGYGLRRWLETAEATGLGERLREMISTVDLVVRGSKASGQVAALDLEPASLTVVASLEEGVDRIIAGPATRVAVQLPGALDDDVVQRLLETGHDVQPLVPYRLQNTDRPAVQSLIQEACARRVDAIIFTAAPAVDAVLEVARDSGLHDEFLRALTDGSVTAAVVGEVCARPLLDVGVQPVMPKRARLAGIVRLMCERAERDRLRVKTRYGDLELRGAHLVVGEAEVWLTPQQVAVIRTLAKANGAVVTRAQLIKAVPGLEGPHALEMTVSRLRRKLPVALIRTVVKRGYALERPTPHM